MNCNVTTLDNNIFNNLRNLIELSLFANKIGNLPK
jgi:hypothetical protein